MVSESDIFRCWGVGVIVDSRSGLTQPLFAFGGPFRSAWRAFSRVIKKRTRDHFPDVLPSDPKKYTVVLSFVVPLRLLEYSLQ